MVPADITQIIQSAVRWLIPFAFAAWGLEATSEAAGNVVAAVTTLALFGASLWWSRSSDKKVAVEARTAAVAPAIK